MARETGLVMMKNWEATPDERTRAWHRGVESVPLDDPFIVDGEELQVPGDPAGSAGNVINCRCTITYTSEEPEWMR